MTCANCTPKGKCTFNCIPESLNNETNVQRSNIYETMLSEISKRNVLRRSLASTKQYAQKFGQNAEIKAKLDNLRNQIDDVNLYINNLACGMQLTGFITINQRSTVELEASKKTFKKHTFEQLYARLSKSIKRFTPEKRRSQTKTRSNVRSFKPNYSNSEFDRMIAKVLP